MHSVASINNTETPILSDFSTVLIHMSNVDNSNTNNNKKVQCAAIDKIIKNSLLIEFQNLLSIVCYEKLIRKA